MCRREPALPRPATFLLLPPLPLQLTVCMCWLFPNVLQDMAAFVDAAHGLGMGVMMDVVYHHGAPSGNELWCVCVLLLLLPLPLAAGSTAAIPYTPGT